MSHKRRLQENWARIARLRENSPPWEPQQKQQRQSWKLSYMVSSRLRATITITNTQQPGPPVLGPHKTGPSDNQSWNSEGLLAPDPSRMNYWPLGDSGRIFQILLLLFWAPWVAIGVASTVRKQER